MLHCTMVSARGFFPKNCAKPGRNPALTTKSRDRSKCAQIRRLYKVVCLVVREASRPPRDDWNRLFIQLFEGLHVARTGRLHQSAFDFQGHGRFHWTYSETVSYSFELELMTAC